MSALDRIGQLRAEGEAAIGAASDSAALEELRIAYLGRKAELPQLLRGVGALPPDERSAVGSAANAAR
ncbi:MAG: phenylalanine--tRNA ligase subunit alpha, partial [Solirubrobacteraceae bacterium]